MKNYLIGFSLLVVIAAVSCKKVEETTLFDKTADQRLTETLAAYQAQLAGEPNGWKGLIYTKTGGIYSFYFMFNDSNRVKMVSSFDSTSAVTLKESSYRVKALQQPSLIFDTYSYIHVLADPNPNVNGGGVGAGLVSDFEFYFDDRATDANQITLIGRYNGSKMVLTRATAQEATAYANGALASALQLNKILTYFKRIIINGTDSTDVNVNSMTSLVSQIDAQGNLLDTSRQTTYYLTLGGLTLLKPIMVGSKSVTAISNFSYNAATSTITATADNLPVVIKGVVKPMMVDVAAPKRWWDWGVAKGSYWVTGTAFHINGVDDAHGLLNVPGYQGFSLYWPQYGTSGGVNYDLFAPVTTNASGGAAILFGAAYRPPTFTADGRIIFPFLGTLGTVPAAANATYTAMRTKMAEAGGYYFVQTGNSLTSPTYDQVSATDGKAWISWEW